MNRTELQAALSKPNVMPFLHMVRVGEGTADDGGFSRLFGGGHFDGFEQHPHKVVQASGYASTAAGAGQFLSKTWDHLQATYGFPDFSPQCQLEGMVALVAERGALDDVLAGRVAPAIALCNKEWASLPGSPYGQPTRTLAQAIKTYTEAGGVLAESEPAKEPSNLQTPEKPVFPLLIPLASALIEAFTPLAKEKITKEIARHTDNPEVANQIASNVIDAAKQLSGQTDPIAAVAAVQADAAMVQKVEDATLDDLAKLAPVLDKLATWDAQAWAAEEQSRDAASKRAAEDPQDQDVFLTRSIVAMVAAMMLGIAVLIGALAWMKVEATIISGLAALFTTLAGTVIGKFSTRYDHRYGSSRSSGAKDAVIGELSRRK